MFNLRKSACSGSSLMSCIYYSTKNFKGRSYAARNPKPVRQQSFGANPGIDAQLSALQLEKRELNDPEIFDKFETQFWDSDKMHDMWTRERFIEKECLGLHQVLRKQFKEEKSPNLLFWDEKLEIRALHEEDPEKWTIMKLALSFPASPSIIKKVLKAKWKLRSQAEIERHDQRVRSNWEALAKDQLYIPNEELRNHFLSFSNRSKAASSPSKDVSIAGESQRDYSPIHDVLKDGGVFSNIYQSYKKLHDSQSGTANENSSYKEEEKGVIEAGLKTLHYPPEKDTFIIPKSVQNVKSYTNQHMTMEAMQKQILFEAETSETINNENIAFVQNPPKKLDTPRLFKALKDPISAASDKEKEDQCDVSPLPEDHHNNSERQTSAEEYLNHSGERSVSEPEKNLEISNSKKYVDLVSYTEHQERGNEEQRRAFQTAHLERTAEESDAIVKAVKSYMSNSSESYPLNIKIPQKVWKKGALYRIKDRFYTDDGEFLYRVPGLSKE